MFRSWLKRTLGSIYYNCFFYILCSEAGSNGPWVRFIVIVFSIYYVWKLAQTTLGSVYYNCFFYIICSEAGSNDLGFGLL